MRTRKSQPELNSGLQIRVKDLGQPTIWWSFWSPLTQPPKTEPSKSRSDTEVGLGWRDVQALSQGTGSARRPVGQKLVAWGRLFCFVVCFCLFCACNPLRGLAWWMCKTFRCVPLFAARVRLQLLAAVAWRTTLCVETGPREKNMHRATWRETIAQRALLLQRHLHKSICAHKHALRACPRTGPILGLAFWENRIFALAPLQ